MYRFLHLQRLAILVILALLLRADSHTMTPVQSGSTTSNTNERMPAKRVRANVAQVDRRNTYGGFRP